jgi:hypothetical protein
MEAPSLSRPAPRLLRPGELLALPAGLDRQGSGVRFLSSAVVLLGPLTLGALRSWSEVVRLLERVERLRLRQAYLPRLPPAP